MFPLLRCSGLSSNFSSLTEKNNDDPSRLFQGSQSQGSRFTEHQTQRLHQLHRQEHLVSPAHSCISLKKKYRLYRPELKLLQCLFSTCQKFRGQSIRSYLKQMLKSVFHMFRQQIRNQKLKSTCLALENDCSMCRILRLFIEAVEDLPMPLCIHMGRWPSRQQNGAPNSNTFHASPHLQQDSKRPLRICSATNSEKPWFEVNLEMAVFVQVYVYLSFA